MQMITSDKFGAPTMPVEVELPLCAKNIVAAAAKKFKAVSKQNKAYHGTTGVEITGAVEAEELEGTCIVLGPKTGWKGAVKLSEQAVEKAAELALAKEAAEAVAAAQGEEPDDQHEREVSHEELVEAAKQGAERTKGVVLCWRDTQQNGYLTNWARSPLVIDEIEYSCAEQWIMAEKARRVGNDTILAKIMYAKLPKQHKALGRSLDRQVVARVWRQPQKWEAQLLGARAKFEQNRHLALRLLRTGQKPIAEASPSDNIFGIGLAPSDPLAQDPANWKGANLLGRALMQVRDELREGLLNPGAQRQVAADEAYGGLPEMDLPDSGSEPPSGEEQDEED